MSSRSKLRFLVGPGLLCVVAIAAWASIVLRRGRSPWSLRKEGWWKRRREPVFSRCSNDF